MSIWSSIACGWALGCLAACCPEPAVRGPCTVVTLEQNGLAAVAVAEQSVRGPDLTLPLAPADRQKLSDYLQAGGRVESQGEDMSIPDAGQTYAGLFSLLADPQNLDLEDLESGTYSAWFKGKPLKQVIDAREARPAEIGSVRAATDGRFWWVFRRTGSGRFDRLVVFSALGDNR